MACPLLHGNKKKETDTEKQFTMTSGGLLIVLRNNSFIDSKQHSLEPTYLVSILKALSAMYRNSHFEFVLSGKI